MTAEPQTPTAASGPEGPPPLRILAVATKTPWPPIDGGRLLLLNTCEALAAGGHQVTLVAPSDDADPEVAERLAACCTPQLVATRPHRRGTALAASLWRREPFSIARHSLRPVRQRVAQLLATGHFDVVHVEQLQALPQAQPALALGVPVVLRAQNVESDLWGVASSKLQPALGMLGWESRRLARWEGRAVSRVAATVALTAGDARRLSGLAGGTEVFRVPAPFQARLPQPPEVLAGAPAVVILGSEGWLPNRDGLQWFLQQVWPVLRQRLPAAVLHVFGIVHRPLGEFPAVVWHTPPHRIEPAFAPGSILAVPLRIASGVRIKVLEAWARGVPVVATPQAASGLEAEDGRELLLAGSEEEFATAIATLHHEPQRAAALTAAGRALLERQHAPSRVATQLVAIYRAVLGQR